ncbi:MAG: domain S-box-containing protein [Acidobacteria bacterium]|nr:domain S-box-containing protein [Acidobacteriota bacterium]
MTLFPSRLRSRLQLVALAAVAPLIAAIAFTQSVARERAHDLILADNLRLVRLAADQQASVFNGARNLLLTLAELPQMRDADPQPCDGLLPKVLRAHPGYLALTVARPDGTIFCSTAPPDRLVLANARDRVWFHRAMQTRTTATGDYQFSAVTGTPAIVVAHPLLDASGQVERVIVAMMDLTLLDSVMSRADLPAGGVLTLFDGTGTILARLPRGDGWIGHQVPDPRPVQELAGGAADYSSESTGVDGVRRFFVNVPVRAALVSGLYLGMGIASDTAFREANRTYRTYLALLGLMSLIGVGVAILGGSLLVLAPVKALRGVADRIAAGDLTARTQLEDSVSGIAELGDAVNAMAGALDAREAALTERAAVMTTLAEVGVALNRPRGLQESVQSCAEAIAMNLTLAAVQISVTDVRTGGVEPLASVTRQPATGPPDRWPLLDDEREIGMMTVWAGRPLPEGVTAGLRSIAASLALGVARHNAEGARRLLAAIVSSSDDAIFGATAAGMITSWNDGAARLLGYAADEILGQSGALLDPPGHEDDLLELIGRVQHGDHIRGRETVRRRRDGSLLPVTLTLSPIKDAAGGVVGLSVILSDMTERRRADARLRLLAHALESTTEMVSVTDVEDRFTFVNAAFLREYGYRADEVLGQTPALVQSPDTRAAIGPDILRESRRDGWKGELPNRRRDGTDFFISLATSSVRDEQGDIIGLVAVARDITERRLLEEQLRQSQKMDAIGQLAGGIAHDFNNLLTVIRGFAEFLAESLAEPDQRHADVVQIQRAAEAATTLTRQLLAFSRKQILAVRVLHIGDVVAQVTPMLRRLIGESIDLRTSSSDVHHAKIDPGQLEQVIMNLAVNARDAMPSGGRLTIDTCDALLDDAFARTHPSVVAGAYVRLSVSDTGYGMDAATQKRVFEPFFTTKPMGQGTGLGLATVYGIVQQSGGTIWLESEPGRGATFTVYFPTTSEAEDAATQMPARTGSHDGSETVLVVEDEAQVRDFVCRVLRPRGYAVHGVGTPAGALAYIQNHGAGVQLVLSDVVLPDMSGPEMVRQMRRTYPRLKALFMSGYVNANIGQGGVIDEHTMFLNKPFQGAALVAKVRAVLDAAPAPGLPS